MNPACWKTKNRGKVIQQLQHDAGRIAVATVAGNLDVLEACWSLGPLLSQAELAPEDPDAKAIGQVCSELDGMPVGATRTLWSPQALERLAPELESLKNWALPLELFRHELEPGLVDEIRRATNGNYALGNAAFAAQVTSALGRRAVPGKSGRPPRVMELAKGELFGG